MARKAKRKGSKNGPQKRSAKKQVNRKNRPADHQRGMGPEATGRDIGRGKPFPRGLEEKKGKERRKQEGT